MSSTVRSRRLIVNADDFGFSAGITEGILRAHREGIVTSTTIAANMPAAESAVAALRGAPSLGVGVHLNVSQGPPLSRPGREKLAGEGGLMNRTAVGVIQAVLRRPWLLGAIEAEFDAQIQWALAHGVRPTHLDSHRHSHAFTPIFACVARLARRYDIPFIRRHREALPGPGWPAAPRKQRRTSFILNRLGGVNRLLWPGRLATSGTWGVAHTGCIDAGWLVRAASVLPAGVTEWMVHPGLPGDVDSLLSRLGDSRRMELSALCDPAVVEKLRQERVELTHYGKLR